MKCRSKQYPTFIISRQIAVHFNLQQESRMMNEELTKMFILFDRQTDGENDIGYH